MQVKKEHYDFFNYVSKERWMSYYYQIREAFEAECSVKGDGIVPAVLKGHIEKVDTFDYDSALLPTYVGDLKNLNEIVKESYDCVVCCQVLEHIERQNFADIIWQISNICTKRMILSLPLHKISFSLCVDFPKFHHKILNIIITRFWVKRLPWEGQHYWEVGIKGSYKKQILNILERYFNIGNEYIVPENPYHWSVILEKGEM